MKQKITMWLLIATGFCLISFIFPNRSYAILYDLKNDWSDTENPNGVWSYRQGDTPLSLQTDWFGNGSNQYAWASASYPNTNHVPVWMKLQTGFYDLCAGDVVVHATSHTSSTSSDLANVIWTSPEEGWISISGNIWYGGWWDSPRYTEWELYLNNNLLDSGVVGYNDSYDRNNPMQIDGGDIFQVNKDDIVKLVVKEYYGYFSYFTGINLDINLETSPQPVPEPATIILLGLGFLGLTTVNRHKKFFRF